MRIIYIRATVKILGIVFVLNLQDMLDLIPKIIKW